MPLQNNLKGTLSCIIFGIWRKALWKVVQTITTLRGPLFAWIEEADQNPQIICRDDLQEAQMAYTYLTQLERVHTKASSKIKRSGRSVSQRRMPRETEKPPPTMIDEKPTDGTSTSKKDQDRHGKMKSENFKGIPNPDDEIKIFFVKMVMEWWMLIFSWHSFLDRVFLGFRTHVVATTVCTTVSVHTPTCCTHTFCCTVCLRTFAHLHAHIHAWLKVVKKVSVACVSSSPSRLLSFRDSLVFLAVPWRSFRDPSRHLVRDFDVHTFLPYSPVLLKAQGMRISARAARSLAIWKSPPSTQIGYSPSQLI